MGGGVVVSLFCAVLLCGCHDDLWKDIHALDDRVSSLELLCSRMNENINALQVIVDALKASDSITSVTPIRENGKEIGFTIAFSKGPSITIYHGKDGADGHDGMNGKDGQNGVDGKDGVNGRDGVDGKDGQNGKDGVNGQNGRDGQTPVVGVRKDEDGVYYWTLNGTWLTDAAGNKIRAEGKDGADGKDGMNGKDGEAAASGKDGADGKDGRDGVDGITPQLKIENGDWYVSTDNGSTWSYFGRATGESGRDGKDGANGRDGADGRDGESGDSFFRDIDYTSDPNYVTFTLYDWTTISIPMYKRMTIEFPGLDGLVLSPSGTFVFEYQVTVEGNAEVDYVDADVVGKEHNIRNITVDPDSDKSTGCITVETENYFSPVDVVRILVRAFDTQGNVIERVAIIAAQVYSEPDPAPYPCMERLISYCYYESSYEGSSWIDGHSHRLEYDNLGRLETFKSYGPDDGHYTIGSFERAQKITYSSEGKILINFVDERGNANGTSGAYLLGSNGCIVSNEDGSVKYTYSADNHLIGVSSSGMVKNYEYNTDGDIIRISGEKNGTAFDIQVPNDMYANKIPGNRGLICAILEDAYYHDGFDVLSFTDLFGETSAHTPEYIPAGQGKWEKCRFTLDDSGYPTCITWGNGWSRIGISYAN